MAKHQERRSRPAPPESPDLESPDLETDRRGPRPHRVGRAISRADRHGRARARDAPGRPRRSRPAGDLGAADRPDRRAADDAGRQRRDARARRPGRAVDAADAGRSDRDRRAGRRPASPRRRPRRREAGSGRDRRRPGPAGRTTEPAEPVRRDGAPLHLHRQRRGRPGDDVLDRRPAAQPRGRSDDRLVGPGQPACTDSARC